MELLICQSCGAIIRSQGKTCKDCGAFATRHTFTPLCRITERSGEPLTVLLANDPLVIERTVNHLLYSPGNGNGNGSGSYEDGNGNGDYADDYSGVASGGNGHGGNDNGLVSEPALEPGEFAGKQDAAAETYSEGSSPIQQDDYDSRPELVAAAAAAAIQPVVHAHGFFGAPVQDDAPPPSQRVEQDPASLVPGNKTIDQRQESATVPERDARSEKSMPASAASPSPEPAEAMEPGKEADEPGHSPEVRQEFFSSAPPDARPPASQPESTRSEFTTPADSASHKQDPGPPADGQQSAPSSGPPAAGQDQDFFQSQSARNGHSELREQFSPPAQDPGVQSGPPGTDALAPASSGSKLSNSDPVTGPASESSGERSTTPEQKNNDTTVPAPRQQGMDFFSSGPSNGSREAQPFADAPPEKTVALKAASGSEAGTANGEALTQLVQSRLNRAGAGPSIKTGARSLGARAAGKHRDPDEEDEEDEDEEDEEEEDEEEEEEEERKERKKDADRERPKRSVSDRFTRKDSEPGATIEILGRSFSKSALITTVILIFVIGFPICVVGTCIVNIFAGTQNNGQAAVQDNSAAQPAGPAATMAMQPAQTGTPTSMTGRWVIEFENPGKAPGQGVLNLVQSGSKLEGMGRDNSGEFQIAGSLQGDVATFKKVYVQGGKQVGKPISYAGRLYLNQNFMQMDGKWELSKRMGYGWRAQIITLGGRFAARLDQPGPNTSGTIANLPSQPSGGGHSAAPVADLATQKDPKKAQSFFMQIALGIIGVGALIAMFSLQFFGPSGLLNIWAKKEYIPSQFKSQHFKMVRELGKPVTTGGVPLGTRVDWGLHQFWLPRRLSMPLASREKNPHMLMVGAGATGKTRLMASMVAQDIESADRAVVLVDSDGGLADLILNWISSRPNGAELAKRVIVVDPTYQGGQSLGYNPLEFPVDEDLQNAAAALVFGFKAAYTEPPGSQTQWNQQTANILRNSSILLMANNKTLADLPVLLSDNDFRDVMLQKIEALKTTRSEFITLVDAWANYKRLARTDQWITWIEPILNRVQPMLSDPRIRAILTKEKSELDLRRVISEKKILIVKIPQGQLEKNGNLLGSLMVAGLKQAALSLCGSSKVKRRPCALYLDEFESFIEKETFDAITTETRKLQIGFCGASKTLQTLPEDFRNKIIINCGIMAIFALAKKDADMLGPQMFRVDGRKIKHQTITNVFNKVNTSPQFELIMDEEKLNIDRVVGQEKQTYFCYRVGSVAGVFCLKAPDFKDIEEGKINRDLLKVMHANRQNMAGEDIDDDDDYDDDEGDDEEEE